MASAGGNISISNGTAGSGTGFNTGNAIEIASSTINAGNGNVAITTNNAGRLGIEIVSSTITTTGSGNVSLTGSGNSYGQGWNASTINAGGSVNLLGTSQTNYGDGNEAGVGFYGVANSITSAFISPSPTGTPAVLIQGKNLANNGHPSSVKASSGTVNIVASNAGNIVIQGQDSGVNWGMDLSGMTVKTNGGALTVGAIPFSAGVAGTSASTGLGVGSFTLNNGFIANGTVLSNLTIGGVNDYGTITVNQVLGCATPTACGATGVSLGNGTTIPAFPVAIQAGGMYASGTNTVASPAALSANSNGGNVYIGGAITVANQPITLLAGQAVPNPAGQATTYSSAAGGVGVMASLLSGGGNITLSNVNPNTGIGNGIASFNNRGVGVGANSGGYSSSMLSINAGGGNIAITGMNTILGVEIDNTNIVTIGNGNINLNGVATLSGTGSWWGLPIGNTINQVSTLSTVNGAITITGSTAATAANSLGLGFWGGGTGAIAVYSTKGAISLTGIASTSNSGIQALGTSATGSSGTETTYIGWSGPAGTGGVTPSIVTTGNISIQGQDGGNNAGMNLAGMSVATNGGSLTVGSTGNGLGSFTLPSTFLASGTSMSSLTVGGVGEYGTITDNVPINAASNVTLNGPANFYAGATYNGVAKNTYGGGIITINSPITTNNAALNLLVGNGVSGAAAAAQGSIYINTTTLTASGANGNITLANGSAGSTGSAFNTDSINITSSTLTAGNNITLTGLGSTRVGVEFDPTDTLTAGTAGISVTGSGATFGVALGGITFNTSGRVSINGTATSSGADGNEAGISMWQGTNNITSSLATGPAITLIGIETTNSRPAITSGSGTSGNGQLNLVASGAGDIKIQGQDNGSGIGMNLSGITTKTNGGALTVGAIPFSAGVAGTSASTGLGVGSFTLNNGFIVNGTVLSNLTIGGVNDYGTITVNQVLGCATPTACGATGVSLGNGTTIPAFPVAIQAGGMYASGTNTVASPAALSANSNGGNVYIGGAITVANPTVASTACQGSGAAICILGGNAVPLTFDAQNNPLTYSSAAGGVDVMASLLSGGGNITLSNVNPITGSGSVTSGFDTCCGGAGRAVAIGTSSSAAASQMITVDATNVAAGVGGNIIISGAGGGWSAVEIDNATVSTLGSNGTGTIKVTGNLLNTGGAFNSGVTLGNTLSLTTSLVSTGGAITITGMTQNPTVRADTGGFSLWTGTNAIYSTTGNITIQGIAQSGSTPAIKNNGNNFYLGWSGSGNGTTGNITLQGQDSGATGTNGGLLLSNVFVKTNGGALTVGAIPFTAGTPGVSASTGLGLGGFTLNNGFIVNGSVLGGLTIGGVNNYGTITMSQVLGCATPMACGATGVSLGNGATIPTFPVTIQAGGMYASGTNTIANPVAALSANATGSDAYVLNTTITTANRPINILAGSAVPNPSGQTTTYSTATGEAEVRSSTLTSGGADVVVSNTPIVRDNQNIAQASSSGQGMGAPGNTLGNDSGTGVFIFNSTINAGGGNIILSGRGGSYYAMGVQIQSNGGSSTLQTTGSGYLLVTGDTGTSGSAYADGIRFYTSAANLPVTLTTASGPITLTGTGRIGCGTECTAIQAANGSVGPIKIYSTGVAGQADITISGYAIGGSSGSVFASTGMGPFYVGWDGVAANTNNVTQANINILGQDQGTNIGMQLGNMFVKTNGGAVTVGAIPFSAGVAGTSVSTGLGVGNFTLNNGFIVNGTVLSNLTIGGLNDYGTITMNQVLGCATPTACGTTGVSLGNGTTIPTFPITIQAGGMYASGTNTVASPAALSPAKTGTTYYGGSISVGGSITTSNQAIKLLASSALNGSTAPGSIQVSGVSLKSNGANIVISNGSIVDPTATDFTNNQSIGASNQFIEQGINLTSSAVIDATGISTGGNILINGTGETIGSNEARGVDVNGSTVKTNNAGTLTLYGDSGNIAGSTNNAGVLLASNVVLSTATGNLTVTGKVRNTGGGSKVGLWFYNGTNSIYSTSGNVQLTGISSASGNQALYSPGSTTYIGWSGPANTNGIATSVVTSGNIAIRGEDSGVNNGMDLTAMYVKTNGGTLTVGSTGRGVGTFTLNNGFIVNGTVLSGLSIGDVNTYGTLTMNQVLGCAGQATTACSSGVTLGTGSGTGNFVAIPVTIQAGGMYTYAASPPTGCTVNVACPAGGTTSPYAGNVSIGGAIITVNQPITILAGQAVPNPAGQTSTYSTAPGGVYTHST